MHKRFCFFIFFLLLIFNAFSTDLMHLKIEKFGVIYDVLELKNQNEILIASEKGVFKYTGKKVTTIHTNMEDSFQKIEIMNGEIYILSFSKKIYKVNNNRLELVVSLKSKESVNDFYCVNDKMFISYPNKLLIYYLNGGQKKIIPKKDDYVFGIVRHNNFKYLCSQSNKQIQFTDLTGDKDFSIKFTSRIQKFFFNKEQSYLLSKNVFYSIDIESKSLKKLFSIPNQLKNVKIFVAKNIDENNIAIGHNDGFFIYDVESGEFSHSFKQHTIHDIIQDTFGNIWLGTKFNGLIQIPSKNIEEYNVSKLLGLNDKIVSTYLSENYLFLGTNFGRIIKYNLQKNKFQYMELNNNADVQSFYIKENNLYVYCDKLYIIDLMSFKIKKTINVHSTKAIYVDEDIYCATSADFQNITKQIKTNVGHWHRCIYFDKEKQGFYLGSNSGVSFIDKKTFKKSNSLSNNLKVVSIKKINNSLMFIGVDGSIYNSDLKIIKKHQINKVKNIAIINSENYILFNNSEVLLVNGVQEKKLNFISKIIQNSPIINIVSHNNNLLILTSEKIYSIKNYKKFIGTKLHSEIELIVESNKKSNQKNEINTSYKETNLSFLLKTNIDLSFFSDYNLYYKINNDEKHKIESNKNGEYVLNLNFLPEGSSAISFLLTNNKGELLNKEKYKINVSSPFWKSIWFTIVLMSVIVTSIYFYQKNRIKKMNVINLEKVKKEQLKTKLVKSQLATIRSQMNPHFVFNTLSTIQLKIAKKETNTAFKLVQKFSSLMRGVLSLSQVEIITLKQEIDILKNYIELENERFDNKIEINIAIDNSLDLNDFNIPSLITQPIVENSLHHGLRHKKGIKKLNISISKINQTTYLIDIVDNGIGIEASKNINKQNDWNKSFAMEAIKKRIKYINSLGNLYVFLKVNSDKLGTQVQIKVNDYD